MEKLTKKEQKELRKMERLEKENSLQKSQVFKKVAIWGGVFLSITLFIFILVKASDSSSNSQSVLATQTANIRPVSKDDLAFGSPKAKVVLIEYSDFQCPACALYNNLVKQTLKDFDGKILFVYRFFPLEQAHKNALISAQAGYAAYLQGKFLEMDDVLFTNQQTWAESSNPQEIFISYAEKLGLDTEKFKTDMNADSTIKIVKNQEDLALKEQIQHTPTFFLNGKEVTNGSDFKQLIQDQLNKK